VDETGQTQRKEQSFKKLGINVISASVTDVDPNTELKNASACANRQLQIAPLHVNSVSKRKNNVC
jgi:hypothetical protein